MGTNRSRGSDSIAAALFGATRQAVLRLLVGHADERFYQRQIVRAVGLGSGAVQRELARLTRCGILTRSVEGRQTYFRANRDCPVFEELRGLMHKTFGVADVLRLGLRPLAGRIRLACIYGSMVKGSERADSDVDLIVVGDDISLGEVVTALRGAQSDLRREINPTVYRTNEFRNKLAAGHHFVSSVAAGPKIFLIGDEHELAGLAEVRLADGASHEPSGNRRTLRRR